MILGRVLVRIVVGRGSCMMRETKVVMGGHADGPDQVEGELGEVEGGQINMMMKTCGVALGVCLTM